MPRKYKPKTRTMPARFVAGFIGRLDGRTDIARRLKTTLAGIVEDAGGPSRMTTARLVLAERLAYLVEFLRRMEQEIGEDPVGKPELVGRWTQGCNAMQGLVRMLGLDRQAAGEDDWIGQMLYADPVESPDTPPAAMQGDRGENTRGDDSGPTDAKGGADT